MSSKQHAERLARAIESSGLAEPVKSTHAENRINVLCRVSEGNEKRWVDLVKKLLVASDEDKHWQVHICRNYFLKEVNGDNKLVWGWNVSVFSENMSIGLDEAISVIKEKRFKSQAANKELTEFPLAGTSANRNVPGPSGKGVHTIGEKGFHPGKKI